MFAAERLAKIREILLDYKHVDVPTLSSSLSVSEATVRRDLEKLEEEGFLKKTHGGAIISDDNFPEVQLNDAEDPFLSEKQQIGIIAAKMINNNEIVFLGSGITCTQIAKNIKDKKDLTVVTNSINILMELSHLNNINVILTGGSTEINGTAMSLIGQFTKKTLESIYVNKAFFTVNGISLKFGYTVNSTAQAEIYSIILKNADEVIVVADYTKFDRRSLTQIGPINMVKRIISNAEVSLEYKKYFFENNIQLFTAFESDENEV